MSNQQAEAGWWTGPVPRWVAVLLGAAATGCAVGWWTGLRPVSTTWGSVAEWVGGVGTVGTLAAAVLAIRGEFKSTQEDRERLRRLQGSQVSAGIVGTEVDEEGLVYLLAVVNASDLPIYSVTATVGPPAGHGDGPSAARELKWLHIPPHREERERLRASLSPTGALILYTVEFKDSSGLGWARSADGDLYEIDPPDYLGCS